MKKINQQNEMENPLYHDTWMLLRKYRDVVWSLELSVQQVRRQFQIEFGNSSEDFLDSIYLAGVDFADTGIQEHARSIERSYKMLKLMENAVKLLRSKHKFGETYYWILYYSYLSPPAVQKHRGDHRAASAAYSGHQLPHLFPQAQGSNRCFFLHFVGLFFQGQLKSFGAFLPGE